MAFLAIRCAKADSVAQDIYGAYYINSYVENLEELLKDKGLTLGRTFRQPGPSER